MKNFRFFRFFRFISRTHHFLGQLSLLLLLFPFLLSTSKSVYAAAWQPPAPPADLPSSLLLKDRVRELKLDNGMTIIIEKKPSIRGVVSHYLAFRAATPEEPLGQTGIAHVLEHMMFKHNEQLALGEYSKTIEALGGSTNASVNGNYTLYYATAPVSALDKVMSLEAKRMRYLKIDPATFLNEMKVIKEERLMRDIDSPFGLMLNQLSALAFANRPQGIPIIGWLKDLEAMKPADVMAFYRRYYVPSNAYLYIVGDVDFDEVEQLAVKHYGPIPKCQPSNLTIQTNNQQLVCSSLPTPIRSDDVDENVPGLTRKNLKLDRPNHQLIMGYRVPSFGSHFSNEKNSKEHIATEKEIVSLMILASILQDRYVLEKVRAGIGSEAHISVGYNSLKRNTTLFIIHGYSTNKNPPPLLEKLIFKEVANINSNGITADELATIKRTTYIDLIRGLQRSDDSYEILSSYMAGYNWQHVDRLNQLFMQITPNDIMKISQKYLVDDNLTIIASPAKQSSSKTPLKVPAKAPSKTNTRGK